MQDEVRLTLASDFHLEGKAARQEDSRVFESTTKDMFRGSTHVQDDAVLEVGAISSTPSALLTIPHQFLEIDSSQTADAAIAIRRVCAPARFGTRVLMSIVSVSRRCKTHTSSICSRARSRRACAAPARRSHGKSARASPRSNSSSARKRY
jgi:hypothetical protein